jgi:hypothetical protein
MQVQSHLDPYHQRRAAWPADRAGGAITEVGAMTLGEAGVRPPAENRAAVIGGGCNGLSGGTMLPTAKVLADEPSGRSGSATIRRGTTLRAVQFVFLSITLPNGAPFGQEEIWKFLAERHFASDCVGCWICRHCRGGIHGRPHGLQIM